MSPNASVEALAQDRRKPRRTVRRVFLACVFVVVALVFGWSLMQPRAEHSSTLQLPLGEDVSFQYLRYVSSEGKGRWESRPLDPKTGKAILRLVEGAKPWQPNVEASWSVAWDWPPARRVYLSVQFEPPSAQLEVCDQTAGVRVLLLDLYGASFVRTDAGRFQVPEDKQRELADLLSSLEQGNH